MAPRLVVLTHEFYPVLSGGTIFVDRLARELVQFGWQLEIWTSRFTGVHDLSTHPSIRVRRFQTFRRSASDATIFEHLMFLVLGLPQFLVQLFRHRPSVVFAVFAVPSGLISVVVGLILRIPTVVFIDAADIPGTKSAQQHLLRHLTALLKFVFRHGDAVVVCEGLEDLAAPLVTNKSLRVIPNGVIIPTLVAAPGTHGEHIRFLSIGRLVARKGFADMLRAFALARDASIKFKLTIVGYGVDEYELQNLAVQMNLSEHVEFSGRVEHEALFEYYSNADAYVFSGDREGSSLAMIEAAAYGLPIIASDHPGNRAYVRTGENGYLVEHGNLAELRDAIVKLTESRNRLATFGLRSREIAGSYTWERVAAQYDSVFRSVIAERKAAAP